MVNHRPHLIKPIITGGSPWSESGVIEVHVACDFSKPISRDSVGYGRVMKGLICAPVIIESGEMVDACRS